jgi:flagellar M-ring protein FliF
VNGLFETLKSLGPVRLAALAGVALASIVFFGFLTTQLSSPDMVLLYADLETKDSSQIVTKLEALGVPYELRANGTQILVPSDNVLRLRMSLAEDGLPKGGSVGYEIFDKSEGFGASNFVQNVNLLRALEGELARTIRSMAQVKTARVHLVMPKRELFSRDQLQPSASIAIGTSGPGQLSKTEVAAIQHLVAAAVPGLKPQRISVVDDKGNLLARGTEGTDPQQDAMNNAVEMRRAFEARLSHQIEELLERSVGPGKVRAKVTADMDFDRITTNEEKYDPEGQVVRSTQTVEEKSDSKDGTQDKAVTVQTNLPRVDPTAKPSSGGESSSSSSNSTRTEESVNYEISRIVKQHTREGGVVRRLSVAVLVDGTYASAADGKKTYTPRPEKEMTQLATVVRSAIGYDEKRGDVVDVVNLRFNDETVAAEDVPAASMFDLSKADYMHIGKIAVLAILGILIILFVFRPILRRIFAGVKLTGKEPEALPAAAGTPALAAPELDVNAEIEKMIDVKQVEGRVRASSIKKIGDIVEKHPDETVAILRNWMYQETGAPESCHLLRKKPTPSSAAPRKPRS